jgi:aminopeptidase C
MSSFDQLSNSFKTSTQQRLHNLENEVLRLTPTESNINDLEAKLKHKVENVKEDLNNQIDDIQNAVISRRPDRNDPNYASKRAQYEKLLAESVKGIDLLQAFLQNILNQLKQTVTLIIDWISKKIANISQLIKGAFAIIFQKFF